MSKQAYYQHDDDAAMAKAARESFALQYAREIRELAPGMGGCKLWAMYKKEFCGESPIGRDRFCRILSEQGMKLRMKMRKPRTTDSTHGLPTYPNLVKDFIPTAPSQLWVSDITYIPVARDDGKRYFCYLSMILDAYSEEIVGWSVGPTLDTAYPIEALSMALKLKGRDTGSLIHHSDRGCQYASREYTRRLRDAGIRISMTETGDPKDNAQAERINSTMKNELLGGKSFASVGEAIAAVAVAVDFYNNRRPHMSIGMMTPAEASRTAGERNMLWRSFRVEAIKNRDMPEIAEKDLPLQASLGSPSDLRSPVNPRQ